MKARVTKKFKADFKEWCGFDLEGTTTEEVVEEIMSRQWQLECDINAQAKGLVNAFKALNTIEDEK